MRKTKAAYEMDKVMYAFVGECGGPEIRSTEFDNLKQEYEDYKSGLFEIDCMIQHFSIMGNEEEVSFWRILAMHNKMVMREIKERMREMVATKDEREVAYS